jgi:peptidoglycan hydrolase-like amidase
MICSDHLHDISLPTAGDDGGSMITREPKIKVALLQNYSETSILLNGDYILSDGRVLKGRCFVYADQDRVLLADEAGREIARGREILLLAVGHSGFTLTDVKIGIDFHWQRTQEESFCGNIILLADYGLSFHLLNEIPLEEYLASVISSEMSATAPPEFLMVQAVVARSWLAAMLKKKRAPRRRTGIKKDDEIMVWQDVNDHDGFDVCADDHCQRYQGITKIISENVRQAIESTRGLFLVYGGEICDARYHKSCGGRTEIFATAWEDANMDYLQSVTCDAVQRPIIDSEADARRLFDTQPPAYCNTADAELLGRILPGYDLETPDFYRWHIVYSRDELEGIIREKSGMDLGELKDLIPLERGPSGRICKLKIEGTKRTVVIGKELEIRRWLSSTHLLSSAFVVDKIKDIRGCVENFILRGGGWGHGVGLCQIGAAVMAQRGFTFREILAHYFKGAEVRKLYG